MGQHPHHGRRAFLPLMHGKDISIPKGTEVSTDATLAETSGFGGRGTYSTLFALGPQQRQTFRAGAVMRVLHVPQVVGTYPIATGSSRVEPHAPLGPKSYCRARCPVLSFTVMSSPTATPREKQGLILDTGRRRGTRVLLSVAIQVSGKDGKNRDFDEETRTLVVNAHGALISLAAAVVAGQQITVSNNAAQQSRDCRIVHLGSGGSGQIQIGIEFLKPSPSFWRIDFPPDDWAVPED